MPQTDHAAGEVFVGIDVAKADHWAHAVAAGGKELFSRAVANDEAAIDALIDEATGCGAVVLVIDQTGSAALLLLEAAANRGVPVAYVPGLVMRRAADLYAGAAKTDPKDAFVLADYASRNSDRLQRAAPADELLARLRVLNGRDADLAADATRASNRLRDALLAVCPPLERAVGDHLAATAGLRQALVRWPTPTALHRAGRARIRTAIARRNPRKAESLADAICAALKSQTITVAAEASWGEAIADLASDLDRIAARRRQLQGDIEEAFMEHPLGKALSTMCGFGPRTGARALAEIGDPHRFDNGSRLASYAGLAPVDSQSGRSHTTRASRRHNHRLKNAMFQAAFTAYRYDPHAAAYYRKKRAEGKKHNQAITALARKRCNIVLAILKTQTPYQPPHTENLPQAA